MQSTKIKKQLTIYLKKVLPLLFVVGCILISCTDKDTELNSEDSKLDLEIPFSLTLSGTSLPKVATRSQQTSAESQIDEIEIFVFENDLYAYKVKGGNIKNDAANNKASFNARLRSYTGKVTFYIIANATASVLAVEPSLQVGSTISQVKNVLTQSFGVENIVRIPLSGSYTSDAGLVSEENTIQNIKMLRAMARMDVHLTQQAATNFKLATIQSFRVANNMQIIPNNITPSVGVAVPSVPVGTQYTINTTPLMVTDQTSSIAQLYTAESVASSDVDLQTATSIVVGGYYNNATELTYYRLDVNPLAQGHPGGQILRNHRYEFLIEQVNRGGYATAAQAAENRSLGIVVSLLSWVEEDIHYIYFNDNSYFGLSDRIIELGGTANSKEHVLISTNVPNYLMDLPSGVFTAQKIGDDKIEFTALQENPANGDVREQILKITADGLQIDVYIHQLVNRDLEWATFNVGEFGQFVEKINDPGKFYQWNRAQSWAIEGQVTGWDANSLNPSAGDRWEASKDPCPAGWRVPTIDEMGIFGNKNKFSRMYYADNETGMWIGPTQADVNAATFENPGNAFYLPYAGYRSPSSGSITSLYTIGYYWTSTLISWGNVPGAVSFPSGGSPHIYGIDDRQGSLIRCVR